MNRVVRLKTSSEKRAEYWKKQLEKNKVEYTITKQFHLFGKDDYFIKFEMADSAAANAMNSMLIPVEDLEFFYGE